MEPPEPQAGPSPARLAGVDEAGRGPLAGPVVAAAVVLPPEAGIHGVVDSKRLDHSRREVLADRIGRAAQGYGIGIAEAEEIDRVNVLEATLTAMARAVAALSTAPGEVWVDGPHVPPLDCRARAIVGGDGSVPSISAASILAKVTRDRLMRDLAEQFPGYGLERHKGYPTREHLDALARHGPSRVHRHSFAPVRAAAAGDRGTARP